MSILALDLETKNMSYDIGGFHNTHMFQVSTVSTWDGHTATVYVENPVMDSISKSGYVTKSLRDLKYDLDEHFEKGGSLLGHNIVSFDLPILRDSLDIYCIHKYLDAKRYVDTSKDLLKSHGERFQLKNLVKCTMNDFKLMESEDAPKLWKAGKYNEVVDYCLKDTKLVYDLYQYGKENNYVKAFSIEKEEFVDLEVDW